MARDPGHARDPIEDLYNKIERLQKQIVELQTAREIALPGMTLTSRPPPFPTEGQVAINHDDDSPYYYWDGIWRLFAEAAERDVFIGIASNTSIPTLSIPGDGTEYAVDFSGAAGTSAFVTRDAGDPATVGLSSKSSPYTGTYFAFDTADNPGGLTIKDGFFIVLSKWEIPNVAAAPPDTFRVLVEHRIKNAIVGDGVGTAGEGGSFVGNPIDNRHFRINPAPTFTQYFVYSLSFWWITNWVKLKVLLRHNHTSGIGQSRVFLGAIRIARW